MSSRADKEEAQAIVQKETQAILLKRTEELKQNLLGRAITIETALGKYEESGVDIRTVKDYIALSTHQRQILGVVDVKREVVDVNINGSVTHKSEPVSVFVGWLNDSLGRGTESAITDVDAERLVLSASVRSPEDGH
jgi:hypothetical protein